MSNNRDNFWDDEEDDNDTEEYTPQFVSDTDLVKKLRKALKAEQKKNRELETNLGELTKSQKERIIRDVLSSRGVNQNIAQFIPSDLEANQDAIGAWLDNNADVFGIKKPEQSAVAQQDVAALQKMDTVLTGAEAASSDSIEARIAAATTEDEILSILSGQ